MVWTRVERMDEYPMDRRVLMTKVIGYRTGSGYTEERSDACLEGGRGH